MMTRLQAIAVGAAGWWAASCGPAGNAPEDAANGALEAVTLAFSCPVFTPPASPYGVTLTDEQQCGCAREGLDMEALCDAFVDVYLDPNGDPSGTGAIDDPVTTLKDAERVCGDGAAPCHIRIAEGTYPATFATDSEAAHSPVFSSCLWIEGGLVAETYEPGGDPSVLELQGRMASAIYAYDVTRIEDLTIEVRQTAIEMYDLAVRTAGLLDNVTIVGANAYWSGVSAQGAGPFYFCDMDVTGMGGGISVSQSTNVVVEGASIVSERFPLMSAGVSVGDSSAVPIGLDRVNAAVVVGSSLTSLVGDPAGASSMIGISLLDTTDVLVLGNEVGSGDYGVYAYDDDPTSSSSGVYIEANTVTVPDTRHALPDPSGPLDIVLVGNTVVEGSP